MDIYTVDIAPGSVHDFELSKQSNLEVRDDIQLTGDKAYQGIQKIHANSLLPFKTSVKIEQVNAYLKGFKIISTRFRNSRSQYAKNKTSVSTFPYMFFFFLHGLFGLG